MKLHTQKSSLQIELLGQIDTFSVHLGLAKILLEDEVQGSLTGIQSRLIEIMELVSSGFVKSLSLGKDVEYLEIEIDRYNKMYPQPEGLILSGEDEKSARIDVARVVARRVERQLLVLAEGKNVPKDLLVYFNRMSDYLYALARMVAFRDVVLKSLSLVAKKDQVVESDSKISYNSEQITLSIAKVIGEAVEKEAKSMGCDIVVCISNKEGNPYLIHRMEDAYVISFGLARKKAYTSAALKMPTHELKNLTQNGKDLEGLEDMLDEAIVTMGGGYPIIVDKKVIGAIGVSGGSVDNDIVLAKYGAKLILDII